MTFREAMILYWTWACIWEGIPSTSRFVMFSSDNPWLRAYNDLMLRVVRQAVPLVSGGLDHQHQRLSTTSAFGNK